MSTSSPAATATVRRFIRSATTGRIKEPVIRNRKPAVTRARMSSASGRWAAMAAFWSTNQAVAPPTSRSGA
jgi:hypothetical protein